MKRLVLSIAALVMGLGATAQNVRPEWDVRFNSAIINDEFDISKCILAPSGTLAALQLSPYAGIGFGDGHRVKAGFTVTKDFGTPGMKPELEWAAWYQYTKGAFTLAAGVFPFSLTGGRYTTLIYSDAARFNDAHCDGLLLRWQHERSNYEIALDWCGKYGETRREEFCLISAGAGWVTPWLALCWEGSFHHYASCAAVQGVVDDHVLHPFIEFEFSSVLPLQRLEVSLGAVAGYHMDRLKEDLRTPLGADAVVDIRKWNFGVKNEFYYGPSQTPFYHERDAAGNEYGNSLYFRSPLWQIRQDGQIGMYDRLDAYWTKALNDYVKLGFHAVFHFDHLGLLGSQQLFQATVNLDHQRFSRNR